MAENPDAPITRITSLEINADPSSPSSVFAPAVLTTAEINAIPLDDLRAGGIVYNINVGSLQTYTINGWENIAVGGSGSDPVFDNITVNDTATINTLDVSGTTTANTINANTLGISGTTTTQELSVTDTATIGTLNVTNTTTTGRLFGTPSSKPTFVLGGGGANGIGNIFGSELAGVFRIGYSGVVGIRPTSVIAIFNLINPMPSIYSVIFTPSPAAGFTTPTCPFTQQAYIQQQSQSQFYLISGPNSTIPDGIYDWQYIIIGAHS